MSTYDVKVSCESLLTLTEIACFAYLNLQRGKLENPLNKANCVCLEAYAKVLGNTIAEILKEPLKSPTFRRELNEMLQEHDSEDVQELAIPWLDEILSWEN